MQGIYTSAAGAHVQLRKIDLLSHNLANANTPAFRVEALALVEREAETREDGFGFGDEHPLLDVMGGGPRFLRSYVEPQSGGIRLTGNKLDLALEGEGFFVVQGGGKSFLTRAGNFIVDAQGFLATADGRHRLLSANGEPIQTGTPDVTVSPDGTILRPRPDGTLEPVAQLRLVRPLAPTDLKREGNNLFAAPADAALAGDAALLPRVAQGYLENSAVEPVREMVGMVEAFRAYETNLRMVRIQDGVLERLINGVGRAVA